MNRLPPAATTIYAPGTQVVALVEVRDHTNKSIHPRGAVGVVVQAPGDSRHSYRVRFPDHFEAALRAS